MITPVYAKGALRPYRRGFDWDYGLFMTLRDMKKSLNLYSNQHSKPLREGKNRKIITVDEKKCLLVHASVKQGLRLETQNGENNCACINTCKCVTRREHINIPDNVLVVVIVAPKGDQGAHAQTVRVEHLKFVV